MSIINTLLLSMRYELNDISGDTFSDYVLINQYNKGNKLLRKNIIDHLPMQLAEEEINTVTAGSSITLTKKPIKFIDVRINDNLITKTSLSEISDKTTTGFPTAYYLLNTSTIKLYPIPDTTYNYEIVYISESVNMVSTDDSGYQTDIEELLVQYVIAALTGKGFDLVTEYNNSIGNLLYKMETGTTVINGYYNTSDGGRDYD